MQIKVLAQKKHKCLVGTEISKRGIPLKDDRRISILEKLFLYKLL